MSKTGEDASENFYDMYKYLVEYDNFIPYLKSLTMSTITMERVQTFNSLKRTHRGMGNVLCMKLYRIFCKCDFTSPLYSNLNRMIL
jgi:hypothetical protein